MSKDTTFPIKVVVNGDTCIAFSNAQVQTIIQAKIDLNYCEKERDSIYTSYITTKDEAVKLFKKAIDGCDSMSYFHEKTIISFKDALKASDEKYLDMKQSFEKHIKVLEKQKQKSKLLGGIGGSIGGLLLGLTSGLLIHYYIH